MHSRASVHLWVNKVRALLSRWGSGGPPSARWRRGVGDLVLRNFLSECNSLKHLVFMNRRFQIGVVLWASDRLFQIEERRVSEHLLRADGLVLILRSDGQLKVSVVVMLGREVANRGFRRFRPNVFRGRRRRSEAHVVLGALLCDVWPQMDTNRTVSANRTSLLIWEADGALGGGLRRQRRESSADARLRGNYSLDLLMLRPIFLHFDGRVSSWGWHKF